MAYNHKTSHLSKEKQKGWIGGCGNDCSWKHIWFLIVQLINEFFLYYNNMRRNNMIWHSFLIFLINLTMDSFYFFGESNCLSKLSKLTHKFNREQLWRENFKILFLTEEGREILRSLSAFPVLKSLDFLAKVLADLNFLHQEYHEKV